MILLMLYIFINILNFFITIFLKVISKNISSTMYNINSRYRTKHPKVSSWKIVGSEYRRWRLKESLILCCWVISIIFEYRAIHTLSFRWRMPKNSPRLLWDWLAIRFFLLFAFSVLPLFLFTL